MLFRGRVLSVAAMAASAAIATAGVGSGQGGMGLVPKGAFALPFRKDSVEVRMKVEAFRLDRFPVTHTDFKAFVKADPDQARSRIKRLFADTAYLADWQDDSTPREGSGKAPVTQVSWYAAKAYCACQGKRLPTTAEWEWAAKGLPPGMDSAGLDRSILAWYARPGSDRFHPVGSGSVNGNGIRDLFGLVWEWTSDFDAYGFAGLNQRGVADSVAFCGAGSATATKEAEYATYMRWAFRLSLRPEYSLGSLGFRCARDLDGKGARTRERARVALPDSSLYRSDARWWRDDGRKMKLEDLRGRVRVVSMFFSNCENLCPMVLGQLKSLEGAMPGALRQKVGFVMVTLDPKEDTSGALSAYRKKSGLAADQWELLRGSADDTRELAALLGVRYTPKTEAGQMGHTGLIAILDRQGRMVSHVTGITDQEAFLAQLSRAVASER
ncbi:MAG: hypothetical protein JWP91_598 [Fibrobacteres bacterium]|nr:hypothetical protein [Fibrobacterota bacterium]